MAKKNEIEKLKRKSRIAALDGLRSQSGFPIAPRKAMSAAKKKSKGLAYPLAPYAGSNILLLYQWARGEWQNLGKWQRLALPVVALVALTTWEKESQLKEARWEQLEREEARQIAAKSYGAFGPTAPKKRGLIRFLPFGKKS